MLTPQEVGEKAFAKSTFGGYTMAQVDEFLDVLTADYNILYTENAVLKSKMKVMVDKVDEYRSTEDAMRKALLTAQRLADDTIRAAEEQKSAMLQEAEEMARAKLASIREERAVEEQRLAEAQRAAAQFIAQAKATYLKNIDQLEALQLILPTPAVVEETPPLQEVDEVVEDIDQNVQRILDAAMADVAASIQEPEAVPVAATQDTVSFPMAEVQAADDDVSFGDLEFGDNYHSN